MKRALAALFGTVAGLVLLLGYKSGPARRTVAAGPRTSNDPGATSAATDPPTTVPAAPGVAGPTDPPTSGEAQQPSATSAASTITGPDEANQYGDVQVQIKIQGGRIVDVAALQLPQDRRRSAEISQYAAPILRTEALAAQGAQIDAVSGATYTSESYAQSLQAAIDQARSGQ